MLQDSIRFAFAFAVSLVYLFVETDIIPDALQGLTDVENTIQWTLDCVQAKIRR